MRAKSQGEGAHDESSDAAARHTGTPRTWALVCPERPGGLSRALGGGTLDLHMSEPQMARACVLQAHPVGAQVETGGADARLGRRLDVMREHGAEPWQCLSVSSSERNNAIMKEYPMHTQEFLPRAYSLPEEALIPEADDVDEPDVDVR